MDLKDTKEALKAVNELALFLAKNLKDGVQFSDATAAVGWLMEPASQQLFKDAFEGIKNVPAEIKDLSLEEALELVSMYIVFVPRMVEALKK